MRKQFELTEIEQRQFSRLRPFQGDALEFWGRAAYVRDLDPDTIISDAPKFSALPLGHGKHWCWPLALKCKKPPIYIEA